MVRFRRQERAHAGLGALCHRLQFLAHDPDARRAVQARQAHLCRRCLLAHQHDAAQRFVVAGGQQLFEQRGLEPHTQGCVRVLQRRWRARRGMRRGVAHRQRQVRHWGGSVLDSRGNRLWRQEQYD